MQPSLQTNVQTFIINMKIAFGFCLSVLSGVFCLDTVLEYLCALSLRSQLKATVENLLKLPTQKI